MYKTNTTEYVMGKQKTHSWENSTECGDLPPKILDKPND